MQDFLLSENNSKAARESVKPATSREVNGLKDASIRRPLSFEYRQKLSKAILGEKNPAKCIKVRKKISKALIKRWKNPVFHKQMCRKMSEIYKKKWQNPIFRKKMSNRLIKYNKMNWKNPTCRKKMLDSLRLRNINNWKNLKFREKMLNIIKENWKDISLQKRMFRIDSKGPNKFETRVQAFLNFNSRIRFNYVGNGPSAIWINGRSPDFINKKKKIIVLANGIYWHLGQYRIEVDNKNKRIHERIKAAPFKEAGYRVIHIWEDEFNRGETKWIKIYY